jgi:hypothetical protein
MRHIRLIFLSLVPTVVLSASIVAPAQAVEGPFYRLLCHGVTAANKGLGAWNTEDGLGRCEEASKGGIGEGEFEERLLNGEVREIKAQALKEYVLKAGAIIVGCKKMKLAVGSSSIGSTGANAGTSKEAFEFEECNTVEKNGAGCKVKGGSITTVALKNELGYEDEGKIGKILVLFQPNAGNAFATIKFEGAECINGQVTVEGSVIGEAWSGGGAVQVALEPAIALANEVNFPIPAIARIWTETAGGTFGKAGGMRTGCRAASLEGRSELKQEGGSWGIFTG